MPYYGLNNKIIVHSHKYYPLQKNVTEDDDTRRWKAYSVLEYVFSQDDFGKSLICRVVHPAYTNDHEETAVKLDLLCKYLTKSL